MSNCIHFLDDPNMIELIYFLSLQDIFTMTKVSRTTCALSIQDAIIQEIYKSIGSIFTYYERYYHVPFYTSHRTHIHLLKIDFIYQNFYIFTNKTYKLLLPLQNVMIPCSYKIKHSYLKKIFKYYTSLVSIYYSKEILIRALQLNKLTLMDMLC
jgi:hypothetical protein